MTPHLRVLAVAALVTQPLVAALGQDPATQRLRDEATAKWADYERAAKKTQGRTEYKRLRDGKRQNEYQTEVLGDGEQSLFIRQFSFREQRGTTYPGFVWATNKYYAFHLERKDATSPWTLKVVEPASNKSAYDRQVADNYAPLSDAREAVTVYGVALADLVREPSFRVIDLRDVDHNGQPAFEVRFEARHPYTQQNGYMPIQSGEMVLSNPHWLLLKFSTKWLKATELAVQGEREYRTDGGATPLLANSTTRVDIAAGPKQPAVKLETTLRCDLRPTTGSLDPAQFRLTAFGLSEPADLAGMFPPPWYTRWYVWTLALAAGLLGLGWYLNRGRRPAAQG